MVQKSSLLKISALLTYVLMVVMNALANILPINGITTGAVSDSYPNLFAPAGVTFSIWGIIYLLLGVYTISFFIQKPDKKQQQFYDQINTYFIATSVINSIWILAWHYRVTWLTVILMLALLFSLIKIADIIKKSDHSLKGRRLTKVAFGIYFGWITIATIANITVFLVSLGWNGWGISEQTWMIVVLCVGIVISIWRTWKDDNLAYGLVPLWAYVGIWLKHTSSLGFNGQYPAIISTVLICLAGLFLSNLFLIIKRKYI